MLMKSILYHTNHSGIKYGNIYWQKGNNVLICAVTKINLDKIMDSERNKVQKTMNDTILSIWNVKYDMKIYLCKFKFRLREYIQS